MTRGQKILVGVVGGVVLVSAGVLATVRSGDQGVEVRMAEVERRDLVSTVTASGNLRPRRTVDISSDVSARVAALEVAEGDDVETGRVLVRLDPTQFEAVLRRTQAALDQAEAQEAQTRANLIQARRNYDRLHSLWQRDTVLVSIQQLDDAETALEVAQANMSGAEFGVRQAEASVEEAQDNLDKTVIRAPMAGKVTRLNIEEGETVIIGTMNNPGSLVLTVSDLSIVELVVQVDETDVPELEIGDSASVTVDAFPDLAFAGRVTEIGNSAIQPPSTQTGQQSAIDFEVVVTLDEPPVLLRPDLSATAEIVTDARPDAPAIPIIALAIRDREDVEASGAEIPAGVDPTTADIEGVFVVRDGAVTFTPVLVGITGREHFEILAGVQVGDTVVSGPYQLIRQLQDGDAVQRRDDATAP